MKNAGLLIWAILRLPVITAGLYLFRAQIAALIEKHFNLGLIIESTIYIISTAWIRFLLFLPFLAVLAGIHLLIRKWAKGDGWGYFYFLVDAFIIIELVSIYLLKIPNAWLPSLLLALFLALNTLPENWLKKWLPRNRIMNFFFVIGLGFWEALFPQAYFYWLTDRLQPHRPSGKWAWLAGVAIACFYWLFILTPYNNQRILTLGEKLHPNPAVEKFGQGGYNWIEFNPEKNLLYAVGHNVNYLMAYDTQHLSQPPRRSSVKIGKPQSFAFNPDLQELYVYRADTQELLYLDAVTLELFRSVPIPDLSPGDVWVNWQRGTDSITIASEADREAGTPFIMLDRMSGEIIASIPLPLTPTNVAFEPDENIFYFNSFRDTYLVAWDMLTHEVIEHVEISPRTDRLVYFAAQSEVLVASPQDGAILRYDATSLDYKGRIDTSLGDRTLTIDPQRNLLLVGNFINNHLQLIDLITYEPITSFYLGPWIRTIALDVEQGVAYVSTAGNIFKVNYGSK